SRQSPQPACQGRSSRQGAYSQASFGGGDMSIPPASAACQSGADQPGRCQDDQRRYQREQSESLRDPAGSRLLCQGKGFRGEQPDRQSACKGEGAKDQPRKQEEADRRVRIAQVGLAVTEVAVDPEGGEYARGLKGSFV